MQCRAQFYPEHFARIAPPPAHDQPPFGMIFVGRIVADKGVFDLLEIARGVEARLPGRVRWEVCGTGPVLDALRPTRGARPVRGRPDPRLDLAGRPGRGLQP